MDIKILKFKIYLDFAPRDPCFFNITNLPVPPKRRFVATQKVLSLF